MTTAPARAVLNPFLTTLRLTALSSVSVILLASLAPATQAASCATTTGDDTCIITLGDIGDPQDGDEGTDTLQFDDAGNTLALTADQFETTGNFVNFENAEVVTGTTVTIESTDTEDAPVLLAWTVDGTLTVFGAGGDALHDSTVMTVNGTFNVDASETIGSLSGTGSVVIADAQTLTLSAGTFTGVISGAGGLTKVGAGTLALGGDNSFSGDTIITGGTLQVDDAGALDNASSITISTLGTLTGTVAFDINGPVENNGSLNGDITITGDVTNTYRIAPGQSPGIITIIGDYSASGPVAHFAMEVDLDAALAAPINGTTHDYIDIQGNVDAASGQTLVLIDALDTPDTGLPTTGDGIQLIRVTGSGAEGQFVQANALTAGLYQYLLRYVEDYSGTDDGYFLQSALRDELFAHPAILSASQEMIRQCFRDDQRVPDSPKGATYGRAWAGYHKGATNYGADTGIDMDVDYGCTTGGMDWRMGHGWFGGIAGGFGSANGDVIVPSGSGSLDGDARVIQAYAAFTSSAFFVNLSAGYADMDWTYSNRMTLPELTSVSGFIASAQAGVALDLDLIAVKLFGAVNYDDTSCGDSCFGFTVAEDTGLVEAKGTVRFDGVTWGGSVRPWASLSYSDVLSDGINSISAGGELVSLDTNSELVSIDAGLQAYLDENFALFADGGYHESLSKDINGYRGGVGLKLYW